MKKHICFIFCIITSLCNAQAPAWTQKAPLDPVNGRTYGVSFSINNVGYAGFGSTNFGVPMSDLWEYDPAANTWTQKTSLPDTGRVGAISFVINNKAFIVGGRSGPSFFRDVWCYDPTLDTWTKLNDFPGDKRGYASAFVLNNKAYVCAGMYTNTPQVSGLKDVWEYAPATDSWTKKADFPGSARCITSGFAVGDYGYMAFGTSGTTSNNELWRYDAAADTWTQKPGNFPIARMASATTVLNDQVYFFGGFGSNQDFIRYTPSTDSWNLVPPITTSNRYGAFAFTLNSKAYVGMGMSSSGNNVEYPDLWELSPGNLGLSGRNETALQLEVFPNPSSEMLELRLNNTSSYITSFTVYNSLGQVIMQKPLEGNISFIDISNLNAGIYILKFESADGGLLTKQFVKQ